MLEFNIGSTTLKIVQGDITEQDTDAIVNAANSGLLGGGGVDGAIHRRGGPQILKECREIRNRQGACTAGDAVVTSGGNLPAKWVIHAVGPVWRGGKLNEPTTLAQAYSTSLRRAAEVGAKTVAFPSISTGAYGYPVEHAAVVALTELRQFIQAHPDQFIDVRMILFDMVSLKAYEKAATEVFGEPGFGS